MRSVPVVLALVAATVQPAEAHGSYQFGCRGNDVHQCGSAARPWGFQWDGTTGAGVVDDRPYLEPWLAISPVAVPASGPHLSVTYEVATVPPGGPRTIRVEARWRTAKGRWSPWQRATVPAGDVGFGLSSPATASWRAKVRGGTPVAWEWHLVARSDGASQVLQFSADVVHHE